MGTRADEYDGAAWASRLFEPVDQKKVSADMTFPVFRPLASQGMIPPFRSERRIVLHNEEHDPLQARHVVAPGSRQSLPILDEGLGNFDLAWQTGPFTGGRSSQGP